MLCTMRSQKSGVKLRAPGASEYHAAGPPVGSGFRVDARPPIPLRGVDASMPAKEQIHEQKLTEIYVCLHTCMQGERE